MGFARSARNVAAQPAPAPASMTVSMAVPLAILLVVSAFAIFFMLRRLNKKPQPVKGIVTVGAGVDPVMATRQRGSVGHVTSCGPVSLQKSAEVAKEEKNVAEDSHVAVETARVAVQTAVTNASADADQVDAKTSEPPVPCPPEVAGEAMPPVGEWGRYAVGEEKAAEYMAAVVESQQAATDWYTNKVPSERGSPPMARPPCEPLEKCDTTSTSPKARRAGPLSKMSKAAGSSGRFLRRKLSSSKQTQ